MRRTRVLRSNHEGKGKKRCRSVESEVLVQLRTPKAKIRCSSNTANVPLTLAGAPATAAAAGVMTRRMARELTVLTDFLEVKEDPSDNYQQIKIDDPEEAVAAVVVVSKEPEKEEENNASAGSEASGRGGGTATEIGRQDDDEVVMNWNAWSFEQEEKAWWGSWYWDWIWYPSSLHINEEVVWEVDIWNWPPDDAGDNPTP